MPQVARGALLTQAHQHAEDIPMEKDHEEEYSDAEARRVQNYWITHLAHTGDIDGATASTRVAYPTYRSMDADIQQAKERVQRIASETDGLSDDGLYSAILDALEDCEGNEQDALELLTVRNNAGWGVIELASPGLFAQVLEGYCQTTADGKQDSSTSHA